VNHDRSRVGFKKWLARLVRCLALGVIPLAVPSIGSAGEINLDVQNLAFVEVSGAIVDELSRPVPHAYLLVTWTAVSYGYHSSTHHCLRAAATETDSLGRFSVTARATDVFRRGLAQQSFDVRVYKNGFTHARSGPTQTGASLGLPRPSAASTLRLHHKEAC
jgi:hypothetical protein